MSSWIVWVGVDPGARATGITVRVGREYVWHTIVVRDRDETEVGPGPVYVSAVARVVGAAISDGHAHVEERTGHASVYRVAVEGVRRPNPHVNRRNGKAVTDPTGIIGAALVLGGILAAYPHAVIVPPGNNGSGLLAAYPAQLVTAAERRLGLDRPAGQSSDLRHARSAWDVSLVAEQMCRLGGAA